jgi:hypothetical protein
VVFGMDSLLLHSSIIHVDSLRNASSQRQRFVLGETTHFRTPYWFFLEVSVLPKVNFSRASRERRFLYNVTDANRGDFPHCTINGFVDDGPSY